MKGTLTQIEINLKKSRADLFQVYGNVIRFNLLQYCPSIPSFGFSVFNLSFSTILSRYCDMLVNSLTGFSVLKLRDLAA